MSPEPGPSGLGRRQALRITAVAGAGLALGGGLVRALLERAGLRRVSETRLQLGTLVTVTVVHPEPQEARAMVDAAFGEMERLEAILSRHRPSTPLARLNRQGTLPSPPRELREVVTRALGYARATDGAFDPTVAPVLDLYLASARSGRGVPEEREVRRALARVGHARVLLDEGGIHFDQPGMSLTLDGIAKGYVVDRTVAALARAGAERVLVDAGGDVASRASRNEGEPWRIAVQDPRSPEGAIDVLHLRGECVASSGDYVETFTADRTLHHIIDPRSGRSPAELAGATVVAASAMDADALSTAVFVMGPRDGLAMLEGLDGVEGILVTKDQTRLRTAGFARLRS